jgi:hypothetical protein
MGIKSVITLIFGEALKISLEVKYGYRAKSSMGPQNFDRGIFKVFLHPPLAKRRSCSGC